MTDRKWYMVGWGRCVDRMGVIDCSQFYEGIAFVRKKHTLIDYINTVMSKPVFIFYELRLNHPNPTWQYPASLFPEGWEWAGAGQTGCAQYPREEQFSGPSSSRTLFRKRLHTFLAQQKQHGKLIRYKIRNSYRPVPNPMDCVPFVP